MKWFFRNTFIEILFENSNTQILPILFRWKRCWVNRVLFLFILALVHLYNKRWLALFAIIFIHSTCILTMALWVKDDWFNFFCNAGIPANTAHMYATAFINNWITETTLPQLNHQYLTELGIAIIGDVLTILAHTTSDPVPTTTTPNTTFPPPKSTKAKSPQFTSEMTHPQFHKFKIDWDIFKRITAILSDQITA